MVRNILVGLVGLLLIVTGGAFLLPQVAHVERSTVMAVSPEEVFSIVNDLTRFNEWSPWAKLDPKAKYTIDGAPSGVGAKMSWTSEDSGVGNGSQEIVESVPFKTLRTKLDFGDKGIAIATFSFEAVEGGTKVVWGFDSDLGMNPVARYVGLTFDSMIGKDYESGLASLKAIVESQANASTQAALATPGSGAFPPDVPMAAEADPSKGPEIVTTQPRPVILTRASAKAGDDAALSAALGGAYQKILTYAETNGVEVGGGAPLAITISHQADGDWVFDAAMPLREAPGTALAEADGVKVGHSYAGRAVKLTHRGPYSTLKETYDRIHAFTKQNKLTEKATTWEEYVGDAGETPDEALLTNVYIAIE